MTASSAQYSCLAVTHSLISAVFLFLPSPLPLMHSTPASPSLVEEKPFLVSFLPEFSTQHASWWKIYPVIHHISQTEWLTDSVWQEHILAVDITLTSSMICSFIIHCPPTRLPLFPLSPLHATLLFLSSFFSVGIPVCICFVAEAHQSKAELVLKMFQPNQVWPWFDSISPARLNPGSKLTHDHFHSLHISAFLLLRTPQVPLRFNAVQMTSLSLKGNTVALLMTEAFILHFPWIYLCWTSHTHKLSPLKAQWLISKRFRQKKRWWVMATFWHWQHITGLL